jgi:HK97 family phage major capsid protein
MPLGIVNSPAAINVARNTANQIKINDIVGMTSSLLPYSWKNGIWATSPTALAQIQQLAQYFINIELDGMYSVKPKPCGALSTMPLFITDKLPPLGTKGDLVLFDPSLYIIGMRQEVVVDVSHDDAFKTNQTTYRIWMRLDAKPELSGSVTLQDASTKTSPYVILK